MRVKSRHSVHFSDVASAECLVDMNESIICIQGLKKFLDYSSQDANRRLIFNPLPFFPYYCLLRDMAAASVILTLNSVA
jgi:hypothetical protein